MIQPSQLVAGQSYYLLLFCDRSQKVPIIRTCIYIGKNLEAGKKGGRDEWHFQDPESYLKHGSFLQLSDKIEHNVLLANEDSLPQFYDLNGLIARLSKIDSSKA